jgi:hypothetical protein
MTSIAIEHITEQGEYTTLYLTQHSKVSDNMEDAGTFDSIYALSVIKQFHKVGQFAYKCIIDEGLCIPA